jgi:hypothetical protein
MIDYADAGAKAEPTPEMLWLTSRFSQPVFTLDQLQRLKAGLHPHALDLVWCRAALKTRTADIDFEKLSGF